MLRPFITQCVPSWKNFVWLQWHNTFNYSSLIKIFQYHFYHLLLLSKQQILSMYNRFFLRNSLPSSHILHIKMPVTIPFRCGMSWVYFHTSEIFMKQMFLFNISCSYTTWFYLMKEKFDDNQWWFAGSQKWSHWICFKINECCNSSEAWKLIVAFFLADVFKYSSYNKESLAV